MEKFGTSACAESFARVVGESDLWQEVDQWNDFLQSWQRKATGAPTVKQAGELITAIKDFCRQNPHWPTDGTLEKRSPALEAITHRVDAEKQPIQDSLERLFHDPLLTSSWLVETKDGKRDHCAERPRGSAGGRLQFRYLLGFDQKERTRVIKADELVREPAPCAARGAGEQGQPVAGANYR